MLGAIQRDVVILVSTKFHWSQHYALARRKANVTLGYFRKVLPAVGGCVFLLFFIQHWWVHTCSIVYAQFFWAPQHKRHMHILETVQQKRMTRMTKGLKHLTYEGSLRELGLFSLEKWTLTEYLMNVYNTWMKDAEKMCPVVPSDMIRGNGQKLEHRRFHANICKHFFFLLWGWLNVGTSCPEKLWEFICGNIQNPYGHGPGQLTLDGPTWAGCVIVYSLLSKLLKAKR